MQKNGFIIVNKSQGMSSHDVVRKARKAFNTRKIGHNGTLDPFADGLLILAIGESTKFLPYLPQEPKVYYATLKLGSTTDTLDHTGSITEIATIPNLDASVIQDTMETLAQRKKQNIPAFSAKRVEGKRLYEHARQQKLITHLEKKIQIYDMSLQSLSATELTFSATVSSGTFIRMLGYDLAKLLGTVGHLSALTRSQIGSISINQACQVSELANIDVHPPEHLLSHIPKLILPLPQIKMLTQGQTLIQNNNPSLYQITDADHRFYGLALQEDEILRAKRLLKTDR